MPDGHATGRAQLATTLALATTRPEQPNGQEPRGVAALRVTCVPKFRGCVRSTNTKGGPEGTAQALAQGWMSEWFKVPVLKTGAFHECRGFESLSIRLNSLYSESTRGPSGPKGGQVARSFHS